MFLPLFFIPIEAIGEDIPSWVKNNAKWWSEEQISDATFLQSIEYLVNQKIIKIDANNQKQVETIEKNIPSWVKNNAKWWSEEQISDATFLQSIEYLVNQKIIKIEKIPDQVFRYSGNSALFEKFALKEDMRNLNGQLVPIEVKLELKEENFEKYSQIGFFDDPSNTIVIKPIFTSTAYWEPGFYTFYRNECDTSCLTKKIEFEKPMGFSGSDLGFKVFQLLNYHTVTDFEFSKNPKIIQDYDKVILLHNEYVTQEMFDAITKHPKVVYLYPNSLYAQIDVNHEKMEINLVRGHQYPEKSIDNGFNWKFDNTRPDEFDVDCLEWQFKKIDNGIQLNCYPENIIDSDFELLKTIRDY